MTNDSLKKSQTQQGGVMFVFDEHRYIIPTVVSLGSSKFSAQVLALHAVLDLLEEIWRLEKTRYLHGFPLLTFMLLCQGTLNPLCPCLYNGVGFVAAGEKFLFP